MGLASNLAKLVSKISSGGLLSLSGLENTGADGQILTRASGAWVPQNAPAGGFGNMQVFTASGTFTVPAGVSKVKVTLVGGGGGGGNGSGTNGNRGSGGGGGGGAIKVITGLTPGGTVSVTVGAGGASATAGGTSSFGAYCSATGGGAGASNAVYVSPNGGVGSGGDLNFYGSGAIQATATYNPGGSSFLGGSNYTSNSSVPGNGTAGNLYGGGGGGAYCSNTSTYTGGAGGAGVVIVEY